ncbi:glycosyltransferase [Rhodospirillum sp. A1_3_36]|uniref:glycosyltransferase n=1 Tax=Rhodospirillum sp. A1_3_36 TaxID=3391666 RepID=UPI0039A57948
MRVLFLHQNFPAQFRHLAPRLATREGWDVRGLGVHEPVPPPLLGVTSYRYPIPDANPSPQPRLREIDTKLRRADGVFRAISTLKEKGFTPDLVIGHPGWGEMLRLGEVLPEAKEISYAEIYYQDTGGDHDFDPEFPYPESNLPLRNRLANAAIDVSMARCRAAVAPTAWQAGRFPAHFQDKIHQIHDGIDTRILKPRERGILDLDGWTVAKGEKVVTFATRYLEPMRGVHTFLRALPLIQAMEPDCKTVVVGRDDKSYWRMEKDKPTHKKRLIAEVSDRLDWDRVRFVPWLQRDALTRLFQVSAAHVYLTFPFVLSWSMLEAMACGAPVIGSRTDPVMEVIEDGVNGHLVDCLDPEDLAERVVAVLRDPEGQKPIRARARETVVEKYDLETVCLPQWLKVIDRVVAS